MPSIDINKTSINKSLIMCDIEIEPMICSSNNGFYTPLFCISTKNETFTKQITSNKHEDVDHKTR